jgi:meso-butanediol dehydrogenase/(S,S)-butanediol dehydrogenase/diacetyl reductase
VNGDLLALPGIADTWAETKAAAEDSGVRTAELDVDVRDEASCQALMALALDRFGRLDVVCANAGVIALGPVADFAAEEWDRVMDINAKGVFLTCKAAIPTFVNQRHGCFVNTASIAGKRGGASVACYSASKFAVIGFTQSLALEMGPHNVRANCLCPGYLGTSMWLNDILSRQRDQGRDTAALFERMSAERVPLGRPQTPDDIGQAAVYLARADNVTGIALNIAGGLEMW